MRRLHQHFREKDFEKGGLHQHFREKDFEKGGKRQFLSQF